MHWTMCEMFYCFNENILYGDNDCLCEIYSIALITTHSMVIMIVYCLIDSIFCDSIASIAITVL